MMSRRPTYIRQFDLQQVAAFGNGNNDRLMLEGREGGRRDWP